MSFRLIRGFLKYTRYQHERYLESGGKVGLILSKSTASSVMTKSPFFKSGRINILSLSFRTRPDATSPFAKEAAPALEPVDRFERAEPDRCNDDRRKPPSGETLSAESV